MAACHRCGASFEVAGTVSRQATCQSCGSWLRSCRNCEFFDPKSKNECMEPQAEPVVDKTVANFCEFFGANRRAGHKTSPANSKDDDPFDRLFRK